MTGDNLITLHGVSVDTAIGRPLFRDLTMTLARGDRVALVGRHGVGKSALLAILAGQLDPERGSVRCEGTCILVPQLFPPPASAGRTVDGADPGQGCRGSPGEQRRAHLRAALSARPDVLLLDEPTHDLDEENIVWLREQLRDFAGALIVVTHERRLLREFDEFFVASETGCRHFRGNYDALMADMGRRHEQAELRYARSLGRLLERERHNETVARRRQRKKNLGRLHEMRRCPSRAKLNENRGYAQESQAKRAILQRERIEAARGWARATRRAMAVQLPLEVVLPAFPDATHAPAVALHDVAAEVGGRGLFAEITLSLARERLAITGPNGSGKTTLLEIMVGARAPTAGTATCDASRIGYIAQHASNWRLSASLLDRLIADGEAASTDALALILRAHRFPFSLADRPLLTLSPGERLRAALICLSRRRPVPELLVLDEPTDHLDFVGLHALESLLASWPGGLVVVSHDRTFLTTIGADRRLTLARKVGTRSA